MIAGNTLPALDTILYDGDAPVPMEDATVTVTVRARVVTGAPRATPLLDDVPAVTDSDTPGRATRAWHENESDTPGFYFVRWRVSSAAGVKDYPTEGPQILEIIDPVEQETAGDVYDPEDIAEDLGLELPLDPVVRVKIARSIRSASAELAGYLNRDSLMPSRTVEHVHGDREWAPENWPVIAIISRTYSMFHDSEVITYDGGIDGRNDPLVQRYVAAAAVADLRGRGGALEQRIPQSITVEGQSVTYPSFRQPPAKGTAGAEVSLADLDRYRRRSIYSRRAPEIYDPRWGRY